MHLLSTAMQGETSLTLAGNGETSNLPSHVIHSKAGYRI